MSNFERELKMRSGVRNSAVASQPCPSGHITRCMRFAPLVLTQIALQATSHTPETSGCVKTHVCMKNKSYTPFKSKNKVKNSENFGFSHSLTLDDISVSS